MPRYLARQGISPRSSSSANTASSSSSYVRPALSQFKVRVLLVGVALALFLCYHYVQIAGIATSEVASGQQLSLSLRKRGQRLSQSLQPIMHNNYTDRGVSSIRRFVESTARSVSFFMQQRGSNSSRNGEREGLVENQTPATAPAFPCRRSYEPTCEMYSYLRFWNREFVESDCGQSPLRIPYDGSAQTPLGNNKFLLFEPDRVSTAVYLSAIHVTTPSITHFKWLCLGWME